MHRDVKPENLMLLDGHRHRDFVKVLDFGVARLCEGEEPTSDPPLLVGTPTCMAPEQIVGGPVDPRTDLYALGCVLFFLLTARYPFEGSDADEVMRHKAQDAPPRLEDVDPAIATPALEQLVAGLLASRPDDRVSNAAAARALFDRALRGTGAPRVTGPPPAVRAQAMTRVRFGRGGTLRVESMLEAARAHARRARALYEVAPGARASAGFVAIRCALVDDCDPLDAWLEASLGRMRAGLADEGALAGALPCRALGDAVLRFGDDRGRALALSLELRGLLEEARAVQAEVVAFWEAQDDPAGDVLERELVALLLGEERAYLFQLDAAREYLRRADASALGEERAPSVRHASRAPTGPSGVGSSRPGQPPLPPAPTLLSPSTMRPPRSHAVVVAPPGPTPPASTPAPEPEATPARVVQLAPLAALEGTREQHRLLHGLAESIDAGEPDGRASIEALVEQLWALAARHFADEEALMAATSMPAFHAHRGKHDELRGQLAHLRAALREGASPRRVRDMVSVLVIEWLGVHIATADHDLERYVRSLPQA